VFPRMSDAEKSIFTAFIRNSDRYLEFGSGGSTCVASQFVKTSVVTVDSSEEWLKKVQETCSQLGYPVVPKLVYVDIGTTGEWGVPTDASARERWPNYHRGIWSDPANRNADLYMIDGRFRVACFMQTLLHCRPDALLMFHDYSSRPHYHVIEEVSRKIAVAEDLSVFLPGERPKDRVEKLLAEYEFDYR